MTWVSDRGVMRWRGVFPDPADEELVEYGYVGPIAAQCGTYSGYRSHRVRGQEPCDMCVTAREVWMQQKTEEEG